MKLIRCLPGAPLLAFALITFAVPASAQDSAPKTETLTGRAAVDRLVGNTMVTRLIENDIGAQEGKLLLRADGTAVWVNIEPGAEPANVSWKVDDRGWLCMSGFPDDTVEDACAGLSITGDVIIMDDGQSTSEGILDIQLVPGNSGGL